MSEPTVTQQQVQEVQVSADLFNPPRVLPVNIDFTDADPYELSQEVFYRNAIVSVTLERGFKWDGASIPMSLPLLPWVLTMIAMQLWASPLLWIAVVAFVLYTYRLLPYMQKMGLHARAMCVHDKLYRAQVVDRVVADAVMLSILESDHVPVDVRFWIYHEVRRFGWIAWRRNRRKPVAKAVAAQDVEVTESAIAPEKGEEPKP